MLRHRLFHLRASKLDEACSARDVTKFGRGHLEPVELWPQLMAQSTNSDLGTWRLDSAVGLVLNSPSLDILPFLMNFVYLSCIFAGVAQISFHYINLQQC
jgi:hypothetical protein